MSTRIYVIAAFVLGIIVGLIWATTTFGGFSIEPVTYTFLGVRNTISGLQFALVFAAIGLTVGIMSVVKIQKKS